MNEMSPENIVQTQTSQPSLEESMSIRFDGNELEDFFGNFKALDITEEILDELGKDFW